MEAVEYLDIDNAFLEKFIQSKNKREFLGDLIDGSDKKKFFEQIISYQENRDQFDDPTVKQCISQRNAKVYNGDLPRWVDDFVNIAYGLKLENYQAL